MAYGKKKEIGAKAEYVAMKTGIHDCGFVVTPAFSFKGESPVSKVSELRETGILEIKCPPHSVSNFTAADAIDRDTQFLCNYMMVHFN